MNVFGAVVDVMGCTELEAGGADEAGNVDEAGGADEAGGDNEGGGEAAVVKVDRVAGGYRSYIRVVVAAPGRIASFRW